MSKKSKKNQPPAQQQNLLYNQDGEYADTYLESLSQDCTATQTTSDSEWKYDNCGCGMNIPWHMITYKMKQNEKPPCPPCPEPAATSESPSMTRLKELTVGPIGQDQFIDLTQEVLNDQLATDDMTIPEIEKQVIKVAGLNTSTEVQENDSTAVYRPKPRAEQVYDPLEERHNEPYMDKIYTYFPDFFENSAQCSSRIEMPWTNILLPKNCSIRKTYKPPKQQKKTSSRERKHASPVKKESKSKIRVKKISRIHMLNSKEAIAISSTLSNLILKPPSKTCPGCSYSQSFLMKPKSKPIEMTNSISHESNLMSIYNLSSAKESKKKTKKSHSSVPMVKSKGSKHSLSKGSISKSSVSKAAKIRSKTDRITSLLDSCKKEMEPIKEGINKLRARIRELNLPDFRETKPANPYCMSSSYGAMMGTELSFTYSQAMPMHCFPCPPYYHAPLYPPMPNMKSITKRAKHRNQINRQTSVSETDSEATPFSDGEEESCSCLGHRAESKDDPKPKLPKEPTKSEDGWDFKIATRIGRTNCFELPTNNEKPTRRNMRRTQNNEHNEQFCKCNKRKSNYKSCGYCQDYKESDYNNYARPIAKPVEANICCKCKEEINTEPKITNMDWFCKCEQKNAPATFKVYDQVGCFCPPSTGGDSVRCNCLQENARTARNCNSEKAETKNQPDDICKSCNRKLNPNFKNNNMNLSKIGFRNTCMDQTTKYQAEKEETKCCTCLPYSESPRNFSQKPTEPICSCKNPLDQSKSQRYANDFIDPEAYSEISQKPRDDAYICNCSLSNKSQMEQNKSQKSVNELSKKCNCNKINYESCLQQNIDKTGVSTIEIEDTISIDRCKCKNPIEASNPNVAKVCNCLKGTSKKTSNESRGDLERTCTCSINDNQRTVDNSAMQFVKSVNSQLTKIQSKCQEALDDNYEKICECGNNQMDHQKSNRTLDESRTNAESTCTCSKSRNESRLDQSKSQRTMDESLVDMAKSVNSQMNKIQGKSQSSVAESRGPICTCGLNRNMSENEQNKSRRLIEESNLNVANTCKCGINKNKSEIDQRSQRTIDESTLDFVNSQKVLNESNVNVGNTCQCGINKNKSEIDQRSQRTINESKISRKTIEGNAGKSCKCGINKNMSEIDQRTINESVVDFVNSQKGLGESNVNVGKTCQCGINRNRSELDQKSQRTLNESKMSQKTIEESNGNIGKTCKCGINNNKSEIDQKSQRSLNESKISQNIIEESIVNVGKTCKCGIIKNRSELDQKSQRPINESTVDFASSQKIIDESNANVGKTCKCGINRNRSELDQKSQRTLNESTVDFESSLKVIDESNVNVGKTCKCGVNKNRSEMDQKSQRTINESNTNTGNTCKCGINKNRSELDQNKSQRTINESTVGIEKSQKTIENAGIKCKCGINRNQSELAQSQSQRTIESTVDIVYSQMSKSQKSVEDSSCKCSLNRNQSTLEQNKSQRTVDASMGDLKKTCGCSKSRSPSRLDQKPVESRTEVDFPSCNCSKSVSPSRMSQRSVNESALQSKSQRTIDEPINEYVSTQFSVVEQPDFNECKCGKSRVNQNVSQRSVDESQLGKSQNGCGCMQSQMMQNSRATDESGLVMEQNCNCASDYPQNYSQRNIDESGCKCSLTRNQSNIVQAASQRTINESRTTIDGSCGCNKRSFAQSTTSMNKQSSCKQSNINQSQATLRNESTGVVCICSNTSRSPSRLNQNQSQKSIESAFTQMTVDTNICNCLASNKQSAIDQTLDQSITNIGDSCVCESNQTRSKLNQNVSQRTVQSTSCDCSVERDLSKTAQYRNQRSNESSVSFADSCVPTLDQELNRSQRVMNEGDSCTCTALSRGQNKIQQNQRTIGEACNCSLINNQSVIVQPKSQKSIQESEVSLKQKCDCASTRNQSRRSIDESTMAVKNRGNEDGSRSGERKCSCSSDKKYKSEADVVKKSASKLTREPSDVGETKRRCRCCANLESGKKCTCSIKKLEESEPKTKKKCVCSSSKSPTRVEETEKPKKKCNSCQTSAPRANKSRTSDSPPTIIKDDMQCTCKKIVDPEDENKPKCACTDGMSKLTITSSKSAQKSADGSNKDLKTIESQVNEPDADEKSLTDKELSNELKSKSGSITKNVTSATRQTTGSQAEAVPEETAQSEANVASPKVPSREPSNTMEGSQRSKSGSITNKEFSKQLNESLQKVKSGESSKQDVVSSSKQDVQKSSKQDVQGSKHSCKARIPIKKSSCECSDDELQVYHSPKEFSKESSKVPCKNRTRASYSRRSRSCLCETGGDDSSSSSCDYVAKVKPKSRARSCECNDIKPLKPKRMVCQKSSADSKESNRPKSCECDSKDSQKSARARTHESSSSFEMKRKKEPECDCEETKRNFDDASDSNACGQEVIECPEFKKQEVQQQDNCECPSSHSGSSDKKVANKPSRLPTLCTKSSDESENNLQIQQSYLIKGDKVATRTVASWVRPCTKVIRKSFEDVSCTPCDAQSSGSKVNFKGITITSKVNLTGTTTPPAPNSSLANTIDEDCMAICNEGKSTEVEDKVEPSQIEVDVTAEKSQVATNTSFVKKKKIYKESKETNTDQDICCCRKAVSSNFARFKLKSEFER